MLFNTKQTLKQIVTLTSKKLEQADLCFGHGTDNSWDEACWLIETLVRREGYEEINEEIKFNVAVLERLQALLSRRVSEKIPLAYLLNEAWFAGLAFYVDDRVIIPRSPIAELIKNRFKPLIKRDPNSILDLCCGSGCIGLASALAFPDSTVSLADLSEEALVVAAINSEKHFLSHRVELCQSSLFDELEGTFDLIISNPPYVGDAEYQSLPAEYKYEPAMALLSENNGLALPIQILNQAADFLSDEGVLVLEVGNSWQALANLYPDAPFLWLEFEHGGEGILSLTREQLKNYEF